MKALIIEDGASKLQSARIALAGWEIEVASSVNAAKMLIRKNSYDLLVVDMNLPTFDMDTGESGRIQHDGGISLMKYARNFQTQAKYILFTQYDNLVIEGEVVSLRDITVQLTARHQNSFLGSVLYNSENDRWMSDFANLLKESK